MKFVIVTFALALATQAAGIRPALKKGRHLLRAIAIPRSIAFGPAATTSWSATSRNRRYARSRRDGLPRLKTMEDDK